MAIQSDNNFARATIDELSLNVENCDVIGQELKKFSHDLNYDLMNRLWNVSWSLIRPNLVKW